MTKKELALLRDCKTALQRWMRTHAPDECSEESVREAYRAINEAGGTLFYIADLNHRISEVLNSHADEPSPPLKGGVPLAEIVAELEKDPEMKRRFDAARATLRTT